MCKLWSLSITFSCFFGNLFKKLNKCPYRIQCAHRFILFVGVEPGCYLTLQQYSSPFHCWLHLLIWTQLENVICGEESNEALNLSSLWMITYQVISCNFLLNVSFFHITSKEMSFLVLLNANMVVQCQLFCLSQKSFSLFTFLIGCCKINHTKVLENFTAKRGSGRIMVRQSRTKNQFSPRTVSIDDYFCYNAWSCTKWI